jgi:LSD1 subclass zinc finger protein
MFIKMEEYEENEEVIIMDDDEESQDIGTPLMYVQPSTSHPVQSPVNKKLNFKCYSCKKKFFLSSSQRNIRCAFCGYRILLKVRTSNYITYKTE